MPRRENHEFHMDMWGHWGGGTSITRIHLVDGHITSAYGGSKAYLIIARLVTGTGNVSTHGEKAQVSVILSYKIMTQLQLTSCLLQYKLKSGRYTCTFAVLLTTM